MDDMNYLDAEKVALFQKIPIRRPTSKASLSIIGLL
jgi:hypothetical protein